MQWSWVNTEYSIHRVQHTLSTAYTDYSIHQVLHHPMIDCLPLPATLSSLGRPDCTQLSTFPRLQVNQWIESQLLSHLPPDLPPPDRRPPSTSPMSIDHGPQVHLQPHSIMASKWIFKRAQSRPPCASLSYTISAPKCNSKLAWSWPPSASLSYTISATKCISDLVDLGLQMHLQTHLCKSLQVHLLCQLNLGLQMHLQIRSINASKCISEFNSMSASKWIFKFTRSRPPSTSPRSHHHGLQVHLQVLSISVSQCYCDYVPVPSAARLAVCIYIERLR